MNRITALAALALSLVAVSGCDALVRAAQGPQGADTLAQEEAVQEGDCSSCLKFKARTPSGINAPPQMP